MDRATLEGSWEKAWRARELGRSLNVKWRTWVASEAYAAGVEQGPEAGCYRLWIEVKEPPPITLAIIVGEIAHDLRSALDHLMWREAVECIGPAKAHSNRGEIYFPIYKTPSTFNRAKSLKHVSKNARALIEQFQPYKRGNGHLVMVDWFNRLDKHRAIHPAAAFPESIDAASLVEWNPAADLLEQRVYVKPGEALKGRANIVCLRFDPSGADPDVKMQAKPPLAISLGDARPHLQGLRITLSIKEVQAVVSGFRSLIP